MSNWTNNAIQFPRLIAEAQAIGLFTESAMHDLEFAMDLTPDEVRELVSRACDEWDNIKSKLLKQDLL